MRLFAEARRLRKVRRAARQRAEIAAWQKQWNDLGMDAIATKAIFAEMVTLLRTRKIAWLMPESD